MKSILFVDDEMQILKSLTRLFMDTDYDVFTAESGEDALNILGEQEIDLIISDMRMPTMDGYQLLCQVKERYPKVLRVILSGYADENLVFKAIQKNIAKLYIFKPWNNEMLMKVIEQIFETEALLSTKDLLILVNNIEELPTIKSSYQRIVQMIESDVDMAQISKEIEKDQAVSTKVLHVANSAFYGVKTGSVKQAVTYLGLQNIRNIVLSTSIIDSMKSDMINGNYVERLWEHAFLTNKILLFLYEKCMGKRIPEVASSAGLLHNIGTVIMLKFFSDEYLYLGRKSEKENIDLIQLEKEKFKASHQETGGYLLKWWDLPFPIVEAALFHHQPLNDKIVNTELVMAVHIAQKYAWALMESPQLSFFYSECFEKTGIKQTDFEDKLYLIDDFKVKHR